MLSKIHIQRDLASNIVYTLILNIHIYNDWILQFIAMQFFFELLTEPKVVL